MELLKWGDLRPGMLVTNLVRMGVTSTALIIHMECEWSSHSHKYIYRAYVLESFGGKVEAHWTYWHRGDVQCQWGLA